MFKKNKNLFLVLGFLLFINGIMAVVSSIVGVKLFWLAWLDFLGPNGSFIVHAVMLVGGILMAALASSGERVEFDDYADRD